MVTTGRPSPLRPEVHAADGLPPHDVAAEEAVIAAILLDEGALLRVLPLVQPSDFFREQHAWCYEACLALFDRTEAITIPTLAHELDRAGKLDALGGEPALAELAGRHFTATGVEAHARIVARDARYRRMIHAAGQIAQMAYQGGPDASRVLSASMGLLGGLLTDSDIGMVKLGSPLDRVTGGGMEWGIPPLDRYTMGLEPGKLTIFAGRKGAGKSMFAAQVARNCAAVGARARIFTMEMAHEEYQDRMAHAIVSVRKRYSNYENPYTEVELDRLADGDAQVAAWDIYASGRPRITVPVIAAEARMADAERHVDLIVVDYLQLMGLTNSKETEAAGLKEITGSLKELAMSIGCHVLLLSQMNRAAHTEMRGKQGAQLKCIVTGAPFPEPFVEGLMGGAVENDADLVVMLQRHTGCFGDGGESLRHMEVVIAANRNGVPGHGMILDNYAMCRLDPLTEQDCFDIAKGDLEMGRRLRIDQCLMRDDWKERERTAASAAAEVDYANF